VSTSAALLLLAVVQAVPAQDRVDVWTPHPLENVFPETRTTARKR